MRVRRGRQSARAKASAKLERDADRAARSYIPLQAAQAYEAAFYATDDESARARIAEKLGNVHFSSSDPLAARGWLQRAVGYYQGLPDGTQGLLRSSLRLARQLWLEGQTPQARLTIDRTFALISRDDHLPSYVHAHVYKAYYAAANDEYEQAAAMLDAIVPDIHAAGVETSMTYHRARGMIAAVNGDVEQCFLELDRSLAAAESGDNGYVISIALHERAHRAMALGHSEMSLAARERAVLTARQFAVGWSIRDHTAEYAYLLHQLGQSQRAADVMREVADASEPIPEVRICMSAFGIPIALATGDDALLRATLLEDTIELSFATTESYCILRTARAFAEWYLVSGRVAEANALLRRGLRYVTYPEYAWELIVFTLVRCREPSIRAMALDCALERGRPSRPRTRAMEAMRQLCSALTQRDRRKAIISAQAALPVLRELRWATYVSAAEDLLARYDVTPSAETATPIGTLTDSWPLLTRRERQVAELALRGLRNRAIAEHLGITERTVESHMTSLLGRLGLRSRWQIGTLAGAGPLPA